MKSFPGRAGLQVPIVRKVDESGKSAKKHRFFSRIVRIGGRKLDNASRSDEQCFIMRTRSRFGDDCGHILSTLFLVV